MERIKREKGFTITELMVVIAIITIVLGTSVYTFVRHLPERRLSTYARMILSDLRFATFKAAADGEPYVVEFYGDYINPWPPTASSQLYFSDLYRIWKYSDWYKYFHNSCKGLSATIHKAGFPVPFLVYDIFDDSGNANLNHDLNKLCGDENPDALSENEVPLPLLEYVHENYVDPPALAADTDWRFIRRLTRFQRRYKIPPGVDLLTRQNEKDGNSMWGYFIVFYPAGGSKGFRFLLRTDPGDPDYMRKPDEETIGGGIFSLGMLLTKQVALREEMKNREEVMQRKTTPQQDLPRAYIQAQRYCQNEGFARAIEVLLASGQISLVSRSPLNFSLPLSKNPNCNMNGHNGLPLDPSEPYWR